MVLGEEDIIEEMKSDGYYDCGKIMKVEESVFQSNRK